MPVFDLHCDTLWQIQKNKKDGKKINILKNTLHVDLAKMKKGTVGVQCFALFDIPQQSTPFKSANNLIDILEREVQKSSDINIAYSYSDIENNLKNGVVSAIITMEDGFFLENDFNKLIALYNRGLRMICLNHNVYNGIGHPNLTFTNGKQNWNTRNCKQGLTEFGFELVTKMNEMGIVVDVSHLSDKGFYDVINTSKKPIVASHSNACGVTDVPRNLTDDMLKKLAYNGGIIGVCFVPLFLGLDKANEKTTIDCVIKHVDYIKKLIGIEHIAFGSDFDGCELDINASFYSSLIQALYEHGYKDDEIEKITHLNALRVFKSNLK